MSLESLYRSCVNDQWGGVGVLYSKNVKTATDVSHVEYLLNCVSWLVLSAWSRRRFQVAFSDTTLKTDRPNVQHLHTTIIILHQTEPCLKAVSVLVFGSYIHFSLKRIIMYDDYSVWVSSTKQIETQNIPQSHICWLYFMNKIIISSSSAPLARFCMYDGNSTLAYGI